MTALAENAIVVAVLFVIAGAVGAAIRYLASNAMNGDFPIGTMVVNLAASFLLGVIVAADDPLPVIVGIGSLGALSTWSTTAVETAMMARRGDGALAAGYLALTVTSGILAAWFGLRLGLQLF